MEMYQLNFPTRSIRSCFFEIHPYMDHNISLFQEFDDPTGLSLVPAIVFNATTADLVTFAVNDSVLESENQ